MLFFITIPKGQGSLLHPHFAAGLPVDRRGKLDAELYLLPLHTDAIHTQFTHQFVDSGAVGSCREFDREFSGVVFKQA